MTLSRQRAYFAVRVIDLLEAKHLAMLEGLNDFGWRGAGEGHG